MIKALLVPAVIGLITWLSKRVSPAMAGMLAGMPITGGPILVVLSLDYGPAYAAQVASTTAGCVAAMSVTMWTMLVSAHWRAPLTMLLASLVYFAVGWLFSPLAIAATLAISLVIWLRAPRTPPTPVSPPDTLWLRMAVGLLLTIVILLAGPRLSTIWAGILAGYPFAAMIIAMFVQREQGAHAARQFCLGALQAMATTGVFYWLVSLWLPLWGYLGFVMALLILLALNVLLMQSVGRRQKTAD